MYKIQKSDYAFGCTSFRYLTKDSIEDAEKLYNEYVKECQQLHDNGSQHKYTITIFQDDIVVKETVIEGVIKKPVYEIN